jgi:hypothetical protein
VPLPHDPGPHWGEVGIHGLHRPREWDVVTIVEAPESEGDDVWFVVLDDERILTDPESARVEALRAEVGLSAPFRAHAVRRAGASWAVAARWIETVELTDDPGGEIVELTWNGYERTVRIDGAPTLAGVPQLERLAAARHATYVVTAERLVDSVWEVAVAAL